MSKKLKVGISLRPEIKQKIDEYADEQGFNRSLAVTKLVEAGLEKQHGSPATVVERIATRTETAVATALLSVTWALTVIGAFVVAGPQTAIEAFGAAGTLGVLAILALGMSVAAAFVWLTLLAGLAIESTGNFGEPMGDPQETLE